jgi:hypothetical protein
VKRYRSFSRGYKREHWSEPPPSLYRFAGDGTAPSCNPYRRFLQRKPAGICLTKICFLARYVFNDPLRHPPSSSFSGVLALASLTAPIGGTLDWTAIAFDENDVLYGIEIVTDALYRIDTTTGACAGLPPAHSFCTCSPSCHRMATANRST